jgi:hypothetical protein
MIKIIVLFSDLSQSFSLKELDTKKCKLQERKNRMGVGGRKKWKHTFVQGLRLAAIFDFTKAICAALNLQLEQKQ